VKPSGKVLLAVLVMLCLLVALYVVQAGISARKVSEGIMETDIFEAMTPETFATTVLLAGFRGILADMLWLRTIEMQDTQQYFELQALYELITRLQPDFEEVWHFAAWNLAYNIFYDAASLDEKWDWLRAGTSLLKDGINKNPRSYSLRWRLGELYVRKYGDPRYPMFAERLRKETGKHPYEHALEWYTEAADPKRFPNHGILQDVSMAQIHSKLAELAHSENRTQDQIVYLENAIGWWMFILYEFPENNLGEKRIVQLSGELAPAYAAVAKQATSREDADPVLGKLRAVAERAVVLWGGYEEGNLERLMIAGKAWTELADAVSHWDGPEAATKELRKAEELLRLMQVQGDKFYHRKPDKPEFLYYRGDATIQLARCAAVRGDLETAEVLDRQGLELLRTLKEKLVSYGDTFKRNDYELIEGIVDELIAEIEARLAAYQEPVVEESETGGG